jgi:glycosyltransferase involved in cell wall biosynthesis
VAYKRFDLAIDAANLVQAPLVVVGEGPERARLEQRAGSTVRFEIDPGDADLVVLLQHARAFLFPGIEDFGMLAVEAQACGTPVVARRGGGAVDSVVEGVTGRFVSTDHVDDWADALRAFDREDFDRSEIREHAIAFGRENFRCRIEQVLAEVGAHG